MTPIATPAPSPALAPSDKPAEARLDVEGDEVAGAGGSWWKLWLKSMCPDLVLANLYSHPTLFRDSQHNSLGHCHNRSFCHHTH